MAGPIQSSISGALSAIAGAATTAKVVGNQKKQTEAAEASQKANEASQKANEATAAEAAELKKLQQQSEAASYVEKSIEAIYNDKDANMQKARSAYVKKNMGKEGFPTSSAGMYNKWNKNVTEWEKAEAARKQANLRVADLLSNPNSSLSISYKYAKGEIDATTYAKLSRQALIDERLRIIDPRAKWLTGQKEKTIKNKENKKNKEEGK